MSKHIGIDVKEDREIAQLMWDCVEYAYQHRQDMIDLIELLRLSGPSRDRRHFFTSIGKGTRDFQMQTSDNDTSPTGANGFPEDDTVTPTIENKGWI